MPASLFSVALKLDGTTWAWGQNFSGPGQLGDNTTTDKSSPVSVVGGHVFNLVYGGGQFSFGLKPDGTAWGWGANESGQLGSNSPPTAHSSPVSVLGDHLFVDLACGGSATVGLKKNGTLWAWGSSSDSQIPVEGTSSPVSVAGEHQFVRLVHGGSHGAGLKADGSVWCWGRGDKGQIGDNDTVTRTSPVSVVGGHSFVDVKGSFGGLASYAIKANGEVWSWGFNSDGDLGDNTVIDKSSPISVVGDHSFIQVTAGNRSAMALKADGSLWGWGNNQTGQLGDNTKTARSSPVSVVGNHSFIQITMRTWHALAFKENGEIWAWGLNIVSGEVGDNTLTGRSSPVLVVGSHVFSTLMDVGLSLRFGQIMRAQIF